MIARMVKKYRRYILPLSALGVLVFAFSSQAAEGETVASHGGMALTFLWIAALLFLAKLSSLIERFGQPSVLGELVMGVIIGNLALLGIGIFEPIKADPIINFLAQLGVVILLFQIGLESNITEMRKVGTRAFFVACIGVVLPFVLGTYIVGPWLLPGLSQSAYLFLGAALTATSVGITARVFQDLGKMKMPEAQIVLGAAVIDDILGLIILAIVSAIVTVGAVSLGIIGAIVAKAVLFLVGAIVVGHLLAPLLGKMFSKINTGLGMKFTLVLGFGLTFAYLAESIGLASIVGAFAAGLVLDAVHFRFFKDASIVSELRETIKHVHPRAKNEVRLLLERHAHRHIEDLIEPIGYFLIPIFFIVTGMSVNLTALLNGPVLLVALAITLTAFIGKIAAGLAAGKVRKSIVGWGMVPRGEVGLIFATIGHSLGVVNDEVFSIIVIMVILTTLLTPPILTLLLKREKSSPLPLPSIFQTLFGNHHLKADKG